MTTGNGVECITKAERSDLLKVVRAREKVAKNATESRAAEIRADFERQLATIYKPEDDPVWETAHKECEAIQQEAQARVMQRCRELGIPEWAAPGVAVGWYSRGENATAKRRTELRRVAYSRIEAIAKTAKTEIERASVDVQTKLISDGLRTEAARTFLEQMPSAESLMPRLNLGEIEKLLPPPKSVDDD
jgi:hypothetical protein